jgi:HEAT repeat protein
MVSGTLDQLLRELRAARDRDVDVSSLTDAIEAQVEADPEGSREAVHGYAGDEGMRLWAVGLLRDPRDFDVLAAGLVDPELRLTALEALASQPDAGRVDDVARSLLDDPDPAVRAKAAGVVAFWARPAALVVLSPLADDPVAHVRMVVGWYLGGLRDRAAEPILRRLLADPDEQVRKFAGRGLTRLNRE